jgi:hypothetical protein
MKTSTKIAVGIGIAIAISVGIAYNKIQKLKKTFEKITIEPINLRNVKITQGNINFNVDVLFFNPTSENFSIKGYVVNLKSVKFFYKGQYIATANAVFSEISIPANNQLVVKNIPVSAPVLSVLQNVVSLIDFKVQDLKVVAVIEIAGKEFIIE